MPDHIVENTDFASEYHTTTELTPGVQTSEHAQVVVAQKTSRIGAIFGGIISIISAIPLLIAEFGPDLIPLVASFNPAWGIAFGAIITMVSIRAGTDVSKHYTGSRTTLKNALLKQR